MLLSAELSEDGRRVYPISTMSPVRPGWPRQARDDHLQLLDGMGWLGLRSHGNGLPLVVLVGPGQAGDSPMFSILFDHLRVPRTAARPPRFDAEKYKRRNTIERGFCEVKQWRGLATGSATPSQVPFTLRRFSQHRRARRGGWPMRV
jgi:hypothetical protein